MTATELKNILADHDDDYCFFWRGKQGSVCIFSDKFIGLSYDGFTTEVKTLEEAMTTAFIDGKTLTEIAEEIDLYG